MWYMIYDMILYDMIYDCNVFESCSCRTICTDRHNTVQWLIKPADALLIEAEHYVALLCKCQNPIDCPLRSCKQNIGKIYR